MAPNFASHTNASAKMIKKYRKLIVLKIYSKKKILSVFEKLDTNNYTTTSEGRQCSVKTVSKPYRLLI